MSRLCLKPPISFSMKAKFLQMPRSCTCSALHASLPSFLLLSLNLFHFWSCSSSDFYTLPHHLCTCSFGLERSSPGGLLPDLLQDFAPVCPSHWGPLLCGAYFNLCLSPVLQYPVLCFVFSIAVSTIQHIRYLVYCLSPSIRTCVPGGQGLLCVCSLTVWNHAWHS